MFERLSWLKRLQISLAIAFVIFAIVLGVLALRTAMGKDPSLGTASTTQVLSTSSASGSSGSSAGSSSGSGSASSGSGSGSSDDDSSAESYYDDSSGMDDGSSASSSSSSPSVAPMTTSQS